MVTLNSDCRIEVFRWVAIIEAVEGFQQPLVLPSLQKRLVDPVFEQLYKEALIGYQQADIPIDMKNLAAFNAVRGIQDWVRGVRLIWETGADPINFIFDGFKLKYKNDLERIIIDLTKCQNEPSVCPIWATQCLIQASSRNSPPYRYTRESTVRCVTGLVNPIYLENFMSGRLCANSLDISDISVLLGPPNEEIEVDSTLRKLVWNDITTSSFSLYF